MSEKPEDAVVPVPCENCEHEEHHPVSWLKEHGVVTCAACGAVQWLTGADVEELAEAAMTQIKEKISHAIKKD